MASIPQLTPAQRRSLRARAHALDPVVLIGDEGLTPAVVAETERALAAHELIKVRAGQADREERESMLERLCRETGAAPVQHIGKILVIYRARPEEARRPATARARTGPPDRSPKAKRSRARRRRMFKALKRASR